jgi:hypothetical protein
MCWNTFPTTSESSLCGVLVNILVAVWSGPLVQSPLEPARHPVVVDFVAFCATLNIVSTILIAGSNTAFENRTWMRILVSCHVYRMPAGAVPTVMYLTYSIKSEPESVSAPRDPVRRAVMDHRVAQRNVVSVMVNPAKTSAVTSKPRRCSDLIVEIRQCLYRQR